MNLIALILTGYCAWKLGQRAAFQDMAEVHQMLYDGRAVLNEDGTVALAEDHPTFAELQREVADLQ